jgi:NADH dehydrogenase
LGRAALGDRSLRYLEETEQAVSGLVEPDLTIAGHDEVYVIGDLAHVELDGALVPGVAPAAIQQGRHAAANIERTLRGQLRLPLRYVDKGMLATIGRGASPGSAR